MTRDTVLAMYPPAGTDHPDELFGHVRVVKTHDSYSVVEPCDFSWLAQDSLERVHAARGEGDTTMASPLSELLQQAMFAHGSARGMRMFRAADSAVRVVSWQTRPGTDGDGG